MLHGRIITPHIYKYMCYEDRDCLEVIFKSDEIRDTIKTGIRGSGNPV